ncbi:MAG: polyribonucleotide nucleotidyltransferase [Pseudomonadales bacterium]|nr:polyribonucleotide nucleotidyltransferase [Pseudomonadales bacterium]
MAYPTYPNTYTTTIPVGDKTVEIEIGRYSEQVSAAVMAKCGETIVHTTVALGRDVNLGYFPLSVDFAEKLYAAGTIKGSRWVKRDGRPSDDSILSARVIDRSLRPLFPDYMTREVQIISTVFSYDDENDPDMLALLSAAIGVSISDIPFDGPMAGLRIGYSKDTQQFVCNPTKTEQETSDLDLIVSGSGEAIVMVEAGANEIPEDVMLEGLVQAQSQLGTMCDHIKEIVTEVGKEKLDLTPTVDEEKQASEEALTAQIGKEYASELKEVILKRGKLEPTGEAELIETIVADLNEGKEPEAQVSDKVVSSIVYALTKKIGRQMIITDKERPDGRATDEVRQIWCEVDVFPRTHGSAMFKRGATQALTIVTLGEPSLGQHLESIEGEEVKHYMHHYNMPPYASGEAGRFGYPKRREIGHGALAERALLPMIPSQEDFPYAIHVVTEIMSSNGSTSQASVCGSTLALMAAGVPIKRPVAGIAMGLMSDGTEYVILSDIQGLEDHIGDMDFKVAGTSEGITAIQMDIKLKGIPRDVLERALIQAKEGRMHIMSKMLECLDSPRAELSEYAPKIEQLTIPADRIGELIGPGGKMIKSIIEQTGADINVDEDEEQKLGIVNVSSPDQAKIDAAVEYISNMMRVVEEGEEFDGAVTRVEDYGAFVEFLPGKEGLVHVSAMSTEFLKSAHDKVKLGDEVHVRVSEIKEDGKIGLSMLSAEEHEQARSQARTNRGGRPAFRGGRGGGRNGGGDRDRGRGRGGERHQRR